MIESILIPLLVIVPAFSGLALLLPMPAFDERRPLWTFTLGSTIATFVLSVVVALNFNWADPTLAGNSEFAREVPWIPQFGLTFGYGLDSISLWLVLLSTFLMPLIVLATYLTPSRQPRQFYLWLLLAQAAMIGAFLATDAIFFFLCFEFTLVPLYFLIGVYGGRERRGAANTFFIYTFAGSMLTFASLLYVAWVYAQANGEWTFNIASLYRAAAAMSPAEQTLVLVGLLAGFAVKAPIFPLHTWLPPAYVEAPVAGTVVLSAVLAKLGTYGILRFVLPMCPAAVAQYAPAIAIFAIAGILYAALICWVQKDLKKLIAYSSVSHLGFVTLGLVALDSQDLGAVGATLYMVNHGLATGALFLCAGMLEDRFRTNDMGSMSGLARAMPLWSFFMVVFVMASVGLPGLNQFVSEFLTLAGAFTSDTTLGWPYGLAAGLGMIFGAIYLLYMVGRVVFGPVSVPAADPMEAGSIDKAHARDLTPREFAALAPLAAVCLLLGFYPYPVLQSLERPVAELTVDARQVAANPVAMHQAAQPSLPPLVMVDQDGVAPEEDGR